MRILCALHAHLALVAALRRFPELAGEPVIVAEAPELRLPVVAASAPALAAGVRPGQPLRQAQHSCPAAAVVSRDAAAVAGLREAVGTALQSLAPRVEVGDHAVFCDITGVHARHSGEDAWATAIARRLAAALALGQPAVGVGGSRLVARIAAGRSEPGRIRRVRPGEEAAFLAPLPLAVLPLEAPVAARLAAFGLDCVGAVAALSPADLQRQFGPEGLRIHRLARGDEREGVLAEPSRSAWAERLVLEGPVGDLEVLLGAARHCARRLGERLVAGGLCCQRVRVTYELEDAGPEAVEEALAQPAAGPDAAWTAALGLLGRLRPGRPVSAVSVEVAGLAPAAGRQTDMLRLGDAARDGIALAAGRMRARFGEGVVVRRPRLALDPGDLPERRFRWEVPAVGAARA